MRITYYGHACFFVEIGNKKLLFDPFISHNPLTKVAKVDISKINPDYILLSHGHEDHLSDAFEIAIQSDAQIIAVYEVQQWFEKQGIPGHGMNTGGKWKFDFGTVKLVNAVHSSMLPDGSYGGNPVGFVVTNDHEGTFYFAGDTALTMDMKLIPLICPKLDFAILPIGDNFTMGYDDAVIASNFIQCNTIIGCHYDTFPPVKLDHSAAKKAFSRAGKNLFLPEIAMTFNIKKK
jgi:L-ascorbate metabolism protein UlaG (beta-lactamase superfamily)